VSECVDLHCASSLKTANALHALVGYRAGTVGYFLSSLKQSNARWQEGGFKLEVKSKGVMDGDSGESTEE